MQSVEVGLDEEQIVCLLDRQEPGPGDLDPVALFETLHCGAHSDLQLNYLNTIVSGLQNNSILENIIFLKL